MINIKIDSRKIKKGDTFVAIRGNSADGHNYIETAIQNGANKIVIEKDINSFDNVEKIVVKNTKQWLTNYIKENYNQTINEMNIIGITGTNGKTTTAYLTYQILNLLNSKTAYIGTIGFYLPNEDVIELPNTTPNILDLYELLLQAKEKKCKNIVMEVSSHALDLKRVHGINFTISAFTNLTQDHLDYHETMEKYLESKKLILNQTKNVFIANNDDIYSKDFDFINKKTIGTTGKDYKIISYIDNGYKTLINFCHNNKNYQVETNLKSDFNVYNYITALAISNTLGYEIKDIINITKNIYPPKGRCEQIKVKKGIAVIDYAHTPDAVEKIIKAFNKNKKRRIITIIGCGGDRDPKKRPLMGNIASTYSDYVIFTSDNPRTEDPKKIMKDILSGVKKDNYEVIFDRKLAIKKALDLIQENDIVLILGKGHENYQIIGKEKNHLDDSEEVKKYIDSL